MKAYILEFTVGDEPAISLPMFRDPECSISHHKDVVAVMAAQSDLVEVKARLKQGLCVKG